MSPKNKKIVIIVLIVLAVCLLTTVILGVIGVFTILPRFTSRATDTPQEEILEPLSTALPNPSSDDLDSAIADSMDQIQSEVSSIRGLEPANSVPRKLLTTEELTEIVTTDFLKEYTPEEAARDAEVLWLLGLLPRDFDLLGFYTDLYSEQIAGYYDDEDKAMFVVKGSGFTGVERDTYAHEYTHALQDQHFDFNGTLGYTDEACEEDSEKCAALQSLIEGDATLTEVLWLQQYATENDFTDIQNFYQSYESPVYDSAPAYMQADFLFPYEQGYEFVQTLYAEGGFEAINQAYTTTQPVSTEQILHPSRYPSDTPIPVEFPNLAVTLGSGWEETERNVMGEWYTWLILSMGDAEDARLAEDISSIAAEGWGGDTYIVLENDQTGETALVVRYIWDSTSEGVEAYTAFQDYTSLRFGDADESGTMQAEGLFSALVRDEGSGFTWIITEDKQTLADIQSALN